MKFLSQIPFVAALAGVVSSHAINRQNLKRSETADVSVQLSSVGNHNVLVAVTNNGAEDLRVFNKGTFLDDAKINRFHVSQNGKTVTFTGIREYLIYNDMPAEFFTDIAAGATKEVTVNLAETYDLDVGGDFEVSTEDFFNLAAGPSSNEFGEEMVPFKSNTLKINIDGAEAARVAKPYGSVEKRSLIAYQECNQQQLDAVLRAMDNCGRIAENAANVAYNGDANKFNEYFKTYDNNVRRTAGDRLRAIGNECRQRDRGVITVHCADVERFCGPNVAAYATSWKNLTVMCPPWFGVLADTQWCHYNDQADIFVHEMSHLNLPGAPPGVADVTYGYDNCMRLNTQDAMNNADSFALFANAVKMRC